MRDFSDPACILDNLADLYRERGPKYRESYKQVGQLMAVLFPDGVRVDTIEQFNCLHVLMMILVKLVRLINTKFVSNDSIEDAAVYCSMLRELMEELRDAKKKSDGGELPGVPNAGANIFAV